MLKKLKLLLRLLNSIEEKNGDLIIHVDGNLRVAVDGHLVQDVSKSCLIKTGTSEGHPLFLNPITEGLDGTTVDSAIELSLSAHQAAMQNLPSPPTSCKPKQPK